MLTLVHTHRATVEQRALLRRACGFTITLLITFLADTGAHTQSNSGTESVAEEGLWLYRHVLPQGVPGLAFVGCEVSSEL